MNYSRKTFIKLSSAAAAGASLSAFPTIVPARAKTINSADLSALYAAAKKEGTVVWWNAQTSQAVSEATRAAFKAKYPGIEVEFIRQGGQVIYQRLTQGLKSGVTECDVFATSDEAHCVELKKQNVLAEFTPVEHDKLYKDFRDLDPDGTYQLGYLNFVLMNYQDKKVLNPPKKWTDLNDPRFKGQLSVAHPGFSGAFATFSVAMYDKYGWDFFTRLEANQPKVNRSLFDGVTDIMAGERLVAIGPYDLASEKRAGGAPIQIQFPTDEAVLVVYPTAVLKNAPHPNAARLFANFVASREYSDVLKNAWFFPIREDVPPADGLKLSSIKYYHNKVGRLVAAVPEVLAKWRETFGV